MAKQRYTTEELIHKLREADVLIGQGQTVAQATKQIGVTGKTYFREGWKAIFKRLAQRAGVPDC